jgi:phosphoglycerate dehydrogenase-like enzyme
MTSLLLSGEAHSRLAGALSAWPELTPHIVADAGDIPAASIAYLTADLFRAKRVMPIAEMLAAGSGPRWAHSVTAGLDHPPFQVLQAGGVRVTRSDAQAPAIADYVLGHVLSRLVEIDRVRAGQQAGAWQRIPFREVGDTRWLLVGFGAIGRQIAQRLRPFGAHITAATRSGTSDPLADACVTLADIPAVLPVTDVIVLACPVDDHNRHMVGPAFLALTKSNSILVNIGRGALVDTDALIAALDGGRLGHAILDVFETEPLPQASPLWAHPGVTATPHCAGAGSGVLARNDRLFLENLRRYLSGEPLMNEASSTGR